MFPSQKSNWQCNPSIPQNYLAKVVASWTSKKSRRGLNQIRCSNRRVVEPSSISIHSWFSKTDTHLNEGCHWKRKAGSSINKMCSLSWFRNSSSLTSQTEEWTAKRESQGGNTVKPKYVSLNGFALHNHMRDAQRWYCKNGQCKIFQSPCSPRKSPSAFARTSKPQWEPRPTPSWD